MNASHESPLLILLPPNASAVDGIRTLLADDDMRHVHYPPLWCLDGAGVDLAAALPRVKTIDHETLGDVIDALHRVCDDQALDALVARRWREVDERVRDYYLQRSTLKTMAAILRMGTPSLAQKPPDAFRRDRIYENAFSIAYRLAREPNAPWDPRAPLEEGTLSYHPFDPSGGVARVEANLESGTGPVLELFAYDAGRAGHRAFAERVARGQRGWRVVDPLSAT